MTTQVANIRWMVRRDLPEILRWELDTPGGWDEARIIQHMQQSNCIARVVEIGDTPIGFAVYRLLPNSIRLLRLSIHPAHRRQGHGRRLMGTLMRLCQSHRRKRLTARVRENALSAQLFFRACGFHGTLKGNQILFRWNVPQE